MGLRICNSLLHASTIYEVQGLWSSAGGSVLRSPGSRQTFLGEVYIGGTGQRVVRHELRSTSAGQQILPPPCLRPDGLRHRGVEDTAGALGKRS